MAARDLKLHWLAGLAALLLVGVLLGSCGGGPPSNGTGLRMIVLGFDGMDYGLTQQLMDAGRMPNFARLVAQGGTFKPLGTAVPPLSPAAWSDFITGMDAGGHGIFDFMHRDPQTYVPVFAMSRVTSGKPTPLFAGWQIPGAGEAELLRRGTPFWQVLTAAGIPTSILRMPVNFPPTGKADHELAGMGTPDILGGYGTFSFYTSELFAASKSEVTGGKVHEVWAEDGVLTGKLYGPPHPFRTEKEELTVDFTAYIDPDEPRILLVVGEEERVLEVGEWSDWVPLEFALIPTQTLHGMCRFYLKSLTPEFQLYASPINFDPLQPDIPLSFPEDYAAELAEMLGSRYYTQTMPEDTKAFEHEVLSADEFLAQARIVNDELVQQYRAVLARFDRGLLFYYIGNLDQVSHMLWQTMDPGHPNYKAERDLPLAPVIPKLYEQVDALIGETAAHLDENTRLVVMSDHGFASWRRAFHLNTWLEKNGYLTLRGPYMEDDPGLFVNVDWSRTRAYAVGFNGLYINLKGREKNGIVDPAEQDALIREIGAKLLATLDPLTGQPAVTRIYPCREYFRFKTELAVGPDLIVGYAKGTRGSSESALGEVGPDVLTNNTDQWGGDHLMDHEAVPGVLLTSRPLKRDASRLQDLAAALLAEFGVEGFPPAPN